MPPALCLRVVPRPPRRPSRVGNRHSTPIDAIGMEFAHTFRYGTPGLCRLLRKILIGGLCPPARHVRSTGPRREAEAFQIFRIASGAGIEWMRSSGASLTPEGLEQVMNPRRLADLIAFLVDLQHGWAPTPDRWSRNFPAA